MKYLFVIIFCVEFIIGLRGVYANADTISSPPEYTSGIIGPVEQCVGNTSVYTADIPISCEANWYVNGELQISLDGYLEYTWGNGGNYLVELDVICDTIIIGFGSLGVSITDLPNVPTQIVGDEEVCTGTTSYYTTQIGFDETCIWVVNGITQISDSTTMSYYWSELGNHIIEVSAVNECGISNPTQHSTVVFNYPQVELGNDTTIFNGQSILLDAGNLGSSYYWSTGDTSQTILVSQTGNYEVVVSNPCGNVSDDIFIDVIVEVEESEKDELKLKIHGDLLLIESLPEDVIGVKIYDNKGSLIHKSRNKNYIYINGTGLFMLKVIYNNNRQTILKFIK